MSGHLNRPGPVGQPRVRHRDPARKALGGVGHLRDHVQKLLRSKTLEAIVREMDLVAAIGVVGIAGKLVDLRVENQPVKTLQVVTARYQFLFQESQQLRVARRVVRPDIVRLMNDASPQKPGPDAIHDILRKPGIVPSRQPIGKNHARVLP